MITIASKKEGFRRCGVAHSQTPTSYPDDRFTAEELQTLQAEPMLVVTVGSDLEDKGTKGKAGKEKQPGDNEGKPADGGNA